MNPHQLSNKENLIWKTHYKGTNVFGRSEKLNRVSEAAQRLVIQMIGLTMEETSHYQ